MSTTRRTPGTGIRLSETLSPSDAPVVKEMQILKTGRFYDPRYKWFNITEKMFSEMITNLEKGILGRTPNLDYDHNAGGKAAGWIKSLFIKDGDVPGQKELWGNVELTPGGQKSLADKDFAYISADFDDQYVDNETGKKHGCVLQGAALTNRPVIRRMDSVIQLSESNLENESQTKGDEMDPKEMEKQLAEANKKLSGLEELMKAEGVQDMEGLMKLIADLKSKASGKEEATVQMGEMKKELSETKAKLHEATKSIKLAEKESQFAKLLSEGKACAAQKEAFMEGDMDKFIELGQPMKLSEEGSSKNPPPATDDVEGEILKEAKKLSEEKKMPLNEAISEVLATNKTLAEKRQKALEV